VAGAKSSAYQLDKSMDVGDQYSHLPPLELQIIRFLLSQDQKDGVHVGTIARAIGKSDEDAEKLRFVLCSVRCGVMLTAIFKHCYGFFDGQWTSFQYY
jgi:hypothetical protein